MKGNLPNFPTPNELPEQPINSSSPTSPTYQPPIDNQQTFPPTQQQPHQEQPTNTNQPSQPLQRTFPPRYPFYTGSSALFVSFGDYCIYWEIAPSIGQKKYDWKQNKIFIKMGIEEVDNIIECLEAYRSGGIQAFQQTAQFLQPKNNQPGTLHFYHPSQKANTSIDVFIGKNRLPGISIIRNEIQTNLKKQVYFPILPTHLRTFIRVHDVYASEAIKKEKVVKSNNGEVNNEK